MRKTILILTLAALLLAGCADVPENVRSAAGEREARSSVEEIPEIYLQTSHSFDEIAYSLPAPSVGEFVYTLKEIISR